MIQYKMGMNAVMIYETPHKCFKCNMAIRAVHEDKYQYNNDKELQALFSCPGCLDYIIGVYTTTPPGYRLKDVLPKRTILSIDIDKEIMEISQRFSEIYIQAMSADTLKFNELAGMGLRKALEFLIKDYCIFKYKEKEDEIKSSRLIDCMNSYIDDNDIKEVAKRAAWLGNDESHYDKKWNDKDIEDLKELLDITIHFIVKKIKADKYITEMPENRTK